jgi:hypothetical protein
LSRTAVSVALALPLFNNMARKMMDYMTENDEEQEEEQKKEEMMKRQ